MARISNFLATLVICTNHLVINGFVSPSPSLLSHRTTKRQVYAENNDDNENGLASFFKNAENLCKAGMVASAMALATTTGSPLPAQAADSVKIASCLFKKCQLPLAKCILNPKCMANVICINTCNGREDEIGCQIKCGDLWENDAVGQFNKCAVSDMECVPKKEDDGSYPVPDPKNLVQSFKTSLWNGRWYITAGQNELFDIFPCQVHFFTETKPGTFFGKLNWRIEEPDGEFFNRDAVQQFVQDPAQPGHLINHDNEYLHYQDDWYIIDYEYDDNKDGIPPFAFVYYRGSNDAWDGYGGAVVYTRAAKLPEELIPRLRKAAEKVNFNFDKDFSVTDNTCKTQDAQEKTLLREKFAGKVVLQSEQQVQAAAVRVRGNAANGVKAQQMFLKQEVGEAEDAFKKLTAKTKEFEQEVIDEAKFLEKEIIDETKVLEKEMIQEEQNIVKEVKELEKEIIGR